MSKKLLVLAVCVVLILTTVLAGCTSKQSNTIKVGWIGSLTGDQAVWGQSELNTIKMLFDEINNNGGVLGKKLEVIGYDTKGDATEAVNAVKRLVSQDKVVAIIGPNSSGSAIAISSILEQYKVPDIATVATNPKVTVVDGKVKPYNFRVCFIDPYQGAVAAGYAYEVLKFKKAAILYDVTDEYSQGLTEFFEKSFKAMGGEIVAKEGFKAGDVDFRAQLSKIKAANPDVIFLPYFYKEVALTAKQAKDLGIKATLMGGDGWPSDVLLQMAGDAINGGYFINHVSYDDPVVQDYKNKYYQKYGKWPELNGYLAYDAVMVLVDAIKRAGSADSEKIKEALETTNLQGITGKIMISKDTHNPEGKEAVVIKIVDGKYVFQQKYAPKQQ